MIIQHQSKLNNLFWRSMRELSKFYIDIKKDRWEFSFYGFAKEQSIWILPALSIGINRKWGIDKSKFYIDFTWLVFCMNLKIK